MACSPITYLMTQAIGEPPFMCSPSYERCEHAIVRGEFPALVFSGDRHALGELPGELTAATPFKFAMPDDRLDHRRDFARTPHMALPLWPGDAGRPIDGVCFVLSDQDHPAVHELCAGGGVEDEHYVIANALKESSAEIRLRERLARLRDLPAQEMILVLGFGDQGSRIARMLCDECQRDPRTIAILDDNPDSVRRAREAGHPIFNDGSDAEFGAIIYTPLMRYERLYSAFVQRGQHSISIDNSSVTLNADHFINRGAVQLETAADRTLCVKADRLQLRSHGLPIQSVHVVRVDSRALAGVTIRHLSGGHRAIFATPTAAVDLAASPGSADRFGDQTWQGFHSAFVSLRDRPDMPVFAARRFCDELWPPGTSRVFPARCTADLGSTRFERIIKRHIDGAEVITASQTSMQQVAIAMAAAHYASDSPIVEIGSALGGSAALMAAATDALRPPFYSIDPETATRHIMRWAFQQQDQLDRLHQINLTSDDAILQLQHLRQRAGLVFIDGLHTYAATLADFMNYAPLVRPGGALLIHDVEPARYSVLRVVVEHVLADPRFTPICMIDGLLVLERLPDR